MANNNTTFWGYETVNGRTFGSWLRAAGRTDHNTTAAKYLDLRTAWRAGEKAAAYTADQF